VSTTLGHVGTLAPPEGSLDRPTLVPSSQSPNSGTKPRPQTAAPRAKLQPVARGARQPCARADPASLETIQHWPRMQLRAAPARRTIQCSGGFCAEEATPLGSGRPRQMRCRRHRHRRRATRAKSGATPAAQSVTSSACGRKRGRRRRSAARPSAVGAASSVPASARQQVAQTVEGARRGDPRVSQVKT